MRCKYSRDLTENETLIWLSLVQRPLVEETPHHLSTAAFEEQELSQG
jgi:hypothetical protein